MGNQINDFRTLPDVRVLIAHPLSGGEGLNLQQANVIVFFSQLYSGAITREQCIGRIVRAGQQEKCTIVDILVHDSSLKDGKVTIDERIYRIAHERKNLATEILDFVRDS